MTTSLAPFAPSTMEVVRRMLTLAQVSGDDVVVDLGCGDGRILFAAVQEFGAKKAIGYEIREDLYIAVLSRIEKTHLGNRLHIHCDDLLHADLSKATVITLHLSIPGNQQVKPKLKEARNGTRIVSHDFRIEGWAYSSIVNVGLHTLYLYTTPKAFGGNDDPTQNCYHDLYKS